MAWLRTRRATVGVSLVLAVLLVVLGAPRLFRPSTLSLAVAVRELGPISGWRCAQSGAYTYDPRRDRPDATLLAEPPEDVLARHDPPLEIERVEADLHGGDSVVWSRILLADGTTDAGRVYVLSPGRLQALDVDLAEGQQTICNAHLADWHIVAEHALG